MNCLLTFLEPPGVIIAHELMHSQQDKLKQHTTLLSYTIKEGRADFFAEPVTRINLSQWQYDFAKQKIRKDIEK